MSTTFVIYTLKSTERKAVRDEIITLFLDEIPGKGVGDLCSNYVYTVDSYGDYDIYLKRPAILNKGFDFTVHISGMLFKKNRTYSKPSHNDIVDVLMSVRDDIGMDYDIIKNEIWNLYRYNTCNLDLVSDFYFLDYTGEERPIAIILLAIKWLFIEQDMTYWNWSGRAKLYSHLKDMDLV